jgi:hypothetical protein
MPDQDKYNGTMTVVAYRFEHGTFGCASYPSKHDYLSVAVDGGLHEQMECKGHEILKVWHDRSLDFVVALDKCLNKVKPGTELSGDDIADRLGISKG